MKRISDHVLNTLKNTALANADHDNGTMALQSQNSLLAIALIDRVEELTEAFNRQTNIIDRQSELLSKMEQRLNQIEDNTNKKKRKNSPPQLGKKNSLNN